MFKTTIKECQLLPTDNSVVISKSISQTYPFQIIVLHCCKQKTSFTCLRRKRVQLKTTPTEVTCIHTHYLYPKNFPSPYHTTTLFHVSNLEFFHFSDTSYVIQFLVQHLLLEKEYQDPIYRTVCQPQTPQHPVAVCQVIQPTIKESIWLYTQPSLQKNLF